MKTKEQKAIQFFRSGSNCAQSVLSAYSGDLKIDNTLAMSISSGFGGGMGRLQRTCGAATGAFMVLGVFNSQKYADSKESKEQTNLMIQKFADKFIAIHGSLVCKTLINSDLNSEKGRQLAREKNLFEEVCEKCVLDSIMIVDELIEI
ncbi:MAG: C-GCAxxG-C-C family protein [Bacteroidales bacterium]|nr:C-GCAxxG-C-C family protein [Bacteroidales bacterium]